ncbi:hypothetical protein Tco_1241496 [Tanacetum coccineum]
MSESTAATRRCSSALAGVYCYSPLLVGFYCSPESAAGCGRCSPDISFVSGSISGCGTPSNMCLELLAV